MKPALLLVDLQGDFLAAPGVQPTADHLIARTALLLDGCRHRRLPVVHIWTTVCRENDQRLPHWKASNRWLCVAGTSGHETPRPLRPLDGETTVHKTGFNAFARPELGAALQDINCDRVIIAGLHLHACVRAVALECLERGLQVLIAEDAIASNDPIHAAATRRWLADRGVEFAATGAVLGGLDGGGKSPLIHRSPRRTVEVLFEVPVAGKGEILPAAAAAQNAGTDWRETSRAFRQQLLEKLANRLDDNAADLARQMALEIGKPVSHGLEEVRRSARNVREVICRGANFAGQTHEAAGIVRRQPLGVVALITPWNNPVAIPIGKIAPALIYGNTVVWKPAPAATNISLSVMKLLHESGVPAGAVQLLTGDHTTAQRLAAEATIDAVSLTGSGLAGHAIQEICARRNVPLQAELSGNNGAIIWDDADLPAAAAQIAWGAFGFAGQRCTANRRVIVSASRFAEVLDGLKKAAEKLNWDDPLEPDTDIGPVIDTGKRDECAASIAGAQAGGAHRVEFLFEARAREEWVRAGAYAQPVIICCDQREHPLVQEETMSPLLVVQRADDFEHALALCDGVRQGLVAALFSHSPGLQRRFLSSMRAGMLKLNTSTAGVDVSLPFGGWKASGLGPPEHGEGDQLFYTRMQAVYGAEKLRPVP